MVNIRNRPISGTSKLVGGMSFGLSSIQGQSIFRSSLQNPDFDIRSRKTVSASRTEMQSDIFSPEWIVHFSCRLLPSGINDMNLPDSDGSTNTKIAKLVISMQGMIRLTV